MTDVLYVALVVVFFALCAGYVRGCDRIVGAPSAYADESHDPEPSPLDGRR